MNRAAEMSSSLEAPLAKLKRREESLLGQAQSLSHAWLTWLERRPWLQRFGKLRWRSGGLPGLRPEPPIDLDSSFAVSLLFHLLLLLLLALIASRTILPTSPEPVIVRLVDIGPPPAAPQKEITKRAAEKARPRERPAPPPPQPKTSEVKATKPEPAPKPEPKPEPIPESKPEPQVEPKPEPEPVPALPSPKALPESPAPREPSFTGQPAESLVQLPTRSAKPEPSSVATAIDVLPKSLAPGKGLLSDTERQAERSATTTAKRPGRLDALSSPEFGPYLEMIKRRVQSVWNYPEGISGTHQLDLLFAIDRGGKLVRVEVLNSSDPRLRSSAVQAMRQASPFPPIPESLKDLAGWPLRMRFHVDFGVKVTR